VDMGEGGGVGNVQLGMLFKRVGPQKRAPRRQSLIPGAATDLDGIGRDSVVHGGNSLLVTRHNPYARSKEVGDDGLLGLSATTAT
jgi:hypothetical protein